MTKKIVVWFLPLIIGSYMIFSISDFSQSSKKLTELIDSPDPCTCSHESLLSMSKGLQKKFEDISGRSFKGEEKFLNGIYGSLFNCTCGKSQCVVTSTTRGLNSISCIKLGLF
tara:strand:+ start:416 stop:754 length:339 start_codon:yes stop_codon:yes gene_type:complete